MKIDKSAQKTIDDIKSSEVYDKCLKCRKCETHMIPAVDSITKTITGHVWKMGCRCMSHRPHFRILVG